MVLAGAWEWSAFLRVSNVALRLLYVGVVAALLPAVWYFTANQDGLKLVLEIAVIWWIVALGWVMFAPRLVSSWAAAIAGVLALVPAWLALMRLRLDFEQRRGVGAVRAPAGAGRRHRRASSPAAASAAIACAPNVSPGKTWEGVHRRRGGQCHRRVHRQQRASKACRSRSSVPLCIAVVAFSIVGDLTESLLKRFAGLKDSGRLFPGHGGVMDRIDSVTGAAPVLFFGLLMMGVTS